MRKDKAPLCGPTLMVLAFVLIAPQALGAPIANPCSLLTAQEVGAALRAQVQPPQFMQTGGCIWRGGGTDSVTIEVPGTGRAGFDNAKSRIAAAVTLTGIGDAAFEFASAAGFVEVGLVKGGTFLTLLVQTRAGAEAIAKSLSGKIASRM